MDSIRVASGFLDSQIQDLLWMQNRLIDHHDNLLRTRNLIQKMNDAILRSQYLRCGVNEVEGLVGDIALETASNLERVARDEYPDL